MFHDILPGSVQSLGVYQEAEERYVALLAEVEALICRGVGGVGRARW